jgi:hypothetical protein
MVILSRLAEPATAVQLLVYVMPVEPTGLSVVVILSGILIRGDTLNRSSMSCANVAASVRWPPEALFLVVETIKPAKANNAIDKITKETSTSTNVKPFDMFEGFKYYLPDMVLNLSLQTPYQNIFCFAF